MKWNHGILYPIFKLKSRLIDTMQYSIFPLEKLLWKLFILAHTHPCPLLGTFSLLPAPLVVSLPP